MSQESSSGNAVAERVRAANISVNGSSSVEAMLANSLREGKPLADDGKIHDSVQAAENAASSFVFVPPGTFNESVTIDTSGLTLLGSGRATLIDGGTVGPSIDIKADNSVVTSLSVVNTFSGDNTTLISAIETSGGSNGKIANVNVRDADGFGINLTTGKEWVIDSCEFNDTDNGAIRVESSVDACIVSRCILNQPSRQSGNGINIGSDDCIISNNIISGSGGVGISISGNDNISIGNRILQSGGDGIYVDGIDNIIANNRISDSSGADLNDAGTGTVKDGNLAGVSN